jgi:50S ribosomal subunit-associated GTPase HflX
MNKIDLAEASAVETLCRRYDAVAVSALKREGLDQLLKAAEAAMDRHLNLSMEDSPANLPIVSGDSPEPAD